jgi:succinate dehydrogenase / fumarate reductase flavoprotein subunit
MLTVAECSALAALERKESRGGHTRDDYPFPTTSSAPINVVIRRSAGRDRQIADRAHARPMPAELKALVQERK